MNKISILNDGTYDVYPVTSAKIVYLNDNKTSVQDKIDNIEGTLGNTIYAERYIADESVNITIEDKDSIFNYIAKLENEIKDLKNQIK